jgi:GH15 family glucan-1,4-alpha-glucosidase
VFAELLDAEIGGGFQVAPSGSYESEQRYCANTNVLETLFRTPNGVVLLTDFMPPRIKDVYEAPATLLLRQVTCLSGSVEMEMRAVPRFDYARGETKVELRGGSLVATHNGAVDREARILTIDCPGNLGINEGKNEARGHFFVKTGETRWIIMQYGRAERLGGHRCAELLEKTLQYWRGWTHRCNPDECVFGGPWHDLVVRSSLVLKLLCHNGTGAFSAAPTTSLPETLGGSRNWDYRFNWIRDSGFIVRALDHLGHTEEIINYLRWLKDSYKISQEPSHLKIMAGLHGEVNLDEQTLDHLSGYMNSRPVRIGNAAVDQIQLDVFGELVWSIYKGRKRGAPLTDDDWDYLKHIINHVVHVWQEPDSGIWEMRDEPRHFVYSKMMCWLALEKGINLIDEFGDKAEDYAHWFKTREDIRADILEKGFDRELNSFVQSYGSKDLDATGLLIPVMGFLPASDPRVQGTIRAIQKRLMKGPFVYRYEGPDGLDGDEGAFLLCSFWMVDALALSGRVEEAETLFMQLLKFVSPLGLLAEEIDPGNGMLLGNFPQAFSHLGLIVSALYLGKAKGRGV